MERKKHKNEATGVYYLQKDFLIGKTIYLNKFRFQIQACDEYTEKYMEDNPENFPQSSTQYVINKIKEGAVGFPSVNDFAVNLVRTIDKSGSGFVNVEDVRSGLVQCRINLTD